jgi:hypothetical protein
LILGIHSGTFKLLYKYYKALNGSITVIDAQKSTKYFQVLSWHLPCRREESHEKYQAEQLDSKLEVQNQDFPNMKKLVKRVLFLE